MLCNVVGISHTAACGVWIATRGRSVMWNVVESIVVRGFDVGFDPQMFCFDDTTVRIMIPCSRCTTIKLQESKM